MQSSILQVLQQVGFPGRNSAVHRGHGPHGLQDGPRHPRLRRPPLRVRPRQAPRRQLGVLLAVAVLRHRPEGRPDPLQGGGPRQELQAEAHGDDWGSEG